MNECIQVLKGFFGDKLLKINEPMKNHTSIKAGGNAAALLTPVIYGDIYKALKICKKHKYPYFIMGNGTNLLVQDEGFDGLIVKLASSINNIELLMDTVIHAGAGAELKDISDFALKHELSGLEFASGIPGTLGGAVYMNAGAYGSEIKDVLIDAWIFNSNLKIDCIHKNQMQFEYRKSIFQFEKLIILDCQLDLKKGKYDDILSLMNELNEKRSQTQPLSLPSAGSVFKRPPGHYAGKLIMDAGLKGFRVGGAQVSEKHCGFIVNTDNATASDIIKLIDIIQKTVKKMFDIDLVPEIQIL